MVQLYSRQTQRRTKNAAGANHVYEIDEISALRRFLIIGSEGGTYYVGEQEFTKQNLDRTEKTINGDNWRQALDLIEEIGTGRVAPKMEPVLVALAMAYASPREEIRKRAEEIFPSIIRTGTHLFHFAEYLKGRRGWGRIVQRSVSNWYLNQDVDRLAYSMLKYQSRDGWSHRDVLNKARPTPQTKKQDALFRYFTYGEVNDNVPDVVQVYENVKKAKDKEFTLEVIRQMNFSREMIPSEFLKDRDIWEAMIPRMGVTALLRNMRNIENYGLLDDVRNHKAITSRLTTDALEKGRVHPLQVYQAYHAVTNQRMKSFLEGLFIESFGLASTPVTGKSIHVSLDVSGSMTWAGGLWGSSDYTKGQPTPIEWGSALVYVMAHTEPNFRVSLFSHRLQEIDPEEIRAVSLEEWKNAALAYGMGATDASLPMRADLAGQVETDMFVTITDNETGTAWGSEPPQDALNAYRKKMRKPDTGFVSIAMTPTPYSVTDIDDPRCFDIVGFDANAPLILNQMITGEL